jgi:hypothetical protein
LHSAGHDVEPGETPVQESGGDRRAGEVVFLLLGAAGLAVGAGLLFSWVMAGAIMFIALCLLIGDEGRVAEPAENGDAISAVDAVLPNPSRTGLGVGRFVWLLLISAAVALLIGVSYSWGVAIIIGCVSLFTLLLERRASGNSARRANSPRQGRGRLWFGQLCAMLIWAFVGAGLFKLLGWQEQLGSLIGIGVFLGRTYLPLIVLGLRVWRHWDALVARAAELKAADPETIEDPTRSAG